MTKEEFINKIYEETQDYRRIQFVNKIAEKELKEENLIKYLEHRIIALNELINEEKDKNLKQILNVRKVTIEDILERLKSGKYESNN